MSESSDTHDLLPAYVAGGLDEDTVSVFREHLASCSTCRRELDFLDQVRAGVERHGPEFFADHPDVDDIVAHATGEDVGADPSSVARHVAICQACSAEVSWVRGEAVPVAAGGARAPRRRAASDFWGWAVAAAATLLLALSWTLRPGVDSIEPEVGPASLGIVRPHERAAGDPNRILLRPGAVTVTLSVVVDLPPRAFPASIEWLDAAGRPLVSDTVAGPDDLVDGIFFPLSCVTKRCPPGDYSVRIASGTADEHRIFLRLVESPHAP